MYLWKCWRDTRVKFLVILGLFVCQGIAFPGHIGRAMNANATQLRGMFFMLLIGVGFIVQTVSWILGIDNVGADIGRSSGDFLLSRPSSRGFFVWTGWMVGMVESVVLWIVFSAISMGNLISHLHHQRLAAATISSSWLAFIKLNLPTVFLMFVINVGLVYGLTYCLGVVMRSRSRALIGVAALLLSYQIVRQIAVDQFHLVLPGMFLYPHGFVFPAVHAFVIRGLIALGFPVLAHFALERMEIHS
jgi:hypothetical protein